MTYDEALRAYGRALVDMEDVGGEHGPAHALAAAYVARLFPLRVREVEEAEWRYLALNRRRFDSNSTSALAYAVWKAESDARGRREAARRHEAARWRNH